MHTVRPSTYDSRAPRHEPEPIAHDSRPTIQALRIAIDGLKHRFIAPAILALLAVPAVGQDIGIPHRSFELENGLRVLVHEDHSTPLVGLNIWYHVGSGYEQAGRTGFAHLFEHIMFEGSANVPPGGFDRWLEAAGADNNGYTWYDRTVYLTTMPSNALELSLWLEADRMGGLLKTLSQNVLDVQRDVVKNERRQSFDNRPYGMFGLVSPEALYPRGHPYSWAGIGSMDDLDAASIEDVEAFFRRYYAPNNAVLAIAGDVRTDEVQRTVERFFGWIPRGEDVERPDVPLPSIAETRHITIEDQVTLPQVNLIWRSVKHYAPDEAALVALAAVLTDGKNSRLHRRLVYTEQTASQVTASNSSHLLSGDFLVRVTAREEVHLDSLAQVVLEEIDRLAATPPTEEELQRVVNGIETGFVRDLQNVGGFSGRAERMNEYYYYTGDPSYVEQELAGYRALTPADVQRAAQVYLHGKNRVVISIVPAGRIDLAAGPGEASQ